MPAPPSDARSFTAEVQSVRPIGDDAVLLRLRPDAPLATVRASRFFMLRREDGASPAIPRPFSIYRQSGGEIEFLIKVMGRGTRALASAGVGTQVRVLGPLGNGWPALDGDGPPWVMLAGGVGSAPFYMAIEQALSGMDGHRPAAASQLHFLFGAARAGLLYDLEAFARLGVAVHAITMDGSRPAGLAAASPPAGTPSGTPSGSVGAPGGHVLQLLEDLWRRGAVPREARLLACGPERMLQATAQLARERGLDCWLSLETLMGCGVGICNGCPVPTRPDGPRGNWPNVKCCVEGPVFEAREVDLVHA